MQIREAAESDHEAIYKLHVASIEFFCAAFYPHSSIKAWIDLKSPQDYKANQDNLFLVALNDEEIVGFAHLDLKQRTIKGLYLKPGHENKGYGKALLNRVESLALKNGISQLNLSSTLNAVNFYDHMKYENLGEASHKLRTGESLSCVSMSKKLILASMSS